MMSEYVGIQSYYAIASIQEVILVYYNFYVRTEMIQQIFIKKSFTKLVKSGFWLRRNYFERH